MSFFPLQSLVMPNIGFSAPEDMYARGFGSSFRFFIEEKYIELDKSSGATFDTFFNGLTVGTWKRHCKINDLSLFLQGHGRFSLRFGIHRIGQAHRWLSEQEVILNEGVDTVVDLAFWQDIDAGLLYFSLMALEDNTNVTGGYYATQTAPEHEVHLGIVITHFNRRNYCIPAINRIKKELLADSRYKDKIELVVVDNSKSILPEEAEGITLIPNKNLGGSGGFMRGLLHLEDEKRFTHCLFMDDDASCEIESIRRTYALAAFAKTEKFAVAGALLQELESCRLFEKGAVFDGLCRPLKQGMDMSAISDLLYAEVSDTPIQYGGWWFFCFELKSVKSYAFPFFVRGDDVAFSLMNNFNICTLNGICCWADDFRFKSGPMAYYLDSRYHLVNYLLLNQIKRTEPKITKIIKILHSLFSHQVHSYCYASAASISLAVEHASKGSKFWQENLDMTAVRAEIAAIPSEEKLTHLNRDEINLSYYNPKRRLIERLAQKISLNGVLIPSRFLKNRTLFQHKGFVGNKHEIYRYKKVYYEYEPLGLGFIVTHDKRRFFREYAVFLKRLYHFWKNYDDMRSDYSQALPKLTSRTFWQEIYAPSVTEQATSLPGKSPVP